MRIDTNKGATTPGRRYGLVQASSEGSRSGMPRSPSVVKCPLGRRRRNQIETILTLAKQMGHNTWFEYGGAQIPFTFPLGHAEMAVGNEMLTRSQNRREGTETAGTATALRGREDT